MAEAAAPLANGDAKINGSTKHEEESKPQAEKTSEVSGTASKVNGLPEESQQDKEISILRLCAS